MPLSLRISAIIAIILTLVMGLAAFLNHAKYENIHLDLLQSRLLVVGQGLKDTVETGLNLGLPLGEVAGFQEAIERETERDANLLSIEIVNINGSRLFGAGELDEDPAASERHVNQTSTTGPVDWRIQDDRTLIVGLPLVNPFGQRVGGLIIRYSRTDYRDELHSVGVELGFVIVLTLAVAIPAIFTLTTLWVKDLDRQPKAGDGIEAASGSAAVEKSRAPDRP